MPDGTSGDSGTEPPPGPESAPKTEVAPPTTPTESTEDWATRFKYLLADFENYRRRAEREREAITRQARAAMLRELLPLLEAFRTARGALSRLPPSDPVRKGLDLLDREWMTLLKHEGVEPVATVGWPFRADEAEAVGEAPATEAHPDGTVAEVVQQGYRFFGGLLRPAKVIVAHASPVRKPEETPPSPEPAADQDEP